MADTGKHLIIGNSATALSAIDAIRKNGDKRPIVLVSAERHPAYSPVLTTYYIGNQIKRDGLFIVTGQYYRKNRVETILGRRAEWVDPQNRVVHLSGRGKLEYHDLLIATGASARPLDNVDPYAAPFVSTLRNIEDAERIRSLARNARKVVVIGAGLVSLQTVKAIWRPDLQITVVVGSDQILSQQLDRESAWLVQRRLEEKGVEILFGRRIEKVERRGDEVRVRTGYGESLPADLVVVGKGVRPNIGLVENTGVKTDWGVLVDDRMRTSVENVYAAGDVAEGENHVSGEREVIATWFNACAQGEIAGCNMAGRQVRREGQIRENVTTLMGLVVATIGQSRPKPGLYEEIRHVDFKRSIIRKFFFNGPYLAGALLIGRHGDAGVLRNCIAGKVDLSRWKASLAAEPLSYGTILRGRDLSPGYVDN